MNVLDKLHAEIRNLRDATPSGDPAFLAAIQALNALFCSLRDSYRPQAIPDEELRQALQLLGESIRDLLAASG